MFLEHTLCIRAITWFQSCQEKWFSFSLFFSIFRTYCSVEKSKKKADKCGSWIFDLKDLFYVVYITMTFKNCLQIRSLPGNNFRNKAQWFDSFICCFCCFFRMCEFAKTMNDSHKTPLVQSFAVTALNPKVSYTLIYEKLFSSS